MKSLNASKLGSQKKAETFFDRPPPAEQAAPAIAPPPAEQAAPAIEQPMPELEPIAPIAAPEQEGDQPIVQLVVAVHPGGKSSCQIL